MLKPIYKKNQKVEIIPTAYLSDKYPSHIGDSGKIIRVVNSNDWETICPEYEVEIGRETHIFPEYSIEKGEHKNV